MRRFTWQEACARRLGRHGLTRPLASVAEASGAVVGMHAQIMSAAELALGVRCTDVTRGTVRDALWTRRELVKTYGPRGTVHLVAAADVAVWSGGLAAAPWAASRRPPSLRMTPEQIDEVVAAVDAALTIGDLTVEELDDEVVARTAPWAGDLVVPGFDAWWPRWRQAIPLAAYRGALCFGPDRGRRTAYTSPRRWIPGFEAVAAEPGLPGLVLAYLQAYGPATADEAALWLGVPATALRPVVAEMAGHLEEVELEGLPALLPAADAETDARRDARATVRLLPYFDPYVVGCHPRRRLFPSDAADRALTRGQAGTRAVLLLDGTVGGIWHHRRSGRSVHLTVEPFTTLRTWQRAALDAEAERVGAILEATPTLTVGTVAAGHHL